MDYQVRRAMNAVCQSSHGEVPLQAREMLQARRVRLQAGGGGALKIAYICGLAAGSKARLEPRVGEV
jgi:hypothetical protein